MRPVFWAASSQQSPNHRYFALRSVLYDNLLETNKVYEIKARTLPVVQDSFDYNHLAY